MGKEEIVRILVVGAVVCALAFACSTCIISMDNNETEKYLEELRLEHECE